MMAALLLPLSVPAPSAGEPCSARVASLEAEIASLREQFAALTDDVRLLQRKQQVAATSNQQVRVDGSGATRDGPADASETSPAPGRRKLSDAPSCCRWTPNHACMAISRQCTFLHEFLEEKTTTHEFAEVGSCLGSDMADWRWQHDAVNAGVSLLSGGTVVTTVPTPLKVTHSASCRSMSPQLTIQLDTSVSRLMVNDSLILNGIDMSTVFARLEAVELPLTSAARDLLLTLPTVSGFRLKNRNNGKCIQHGVSGNSFPSNVAMHQKIILALPCDENEGDQVWEWSGRLLSSSSVSQGNDCIVPNGWATSSGTTLVSQSCEDAGQSYYWEWRGETLVNVKNNKCIQLSTAQEANGGLRIKQEVCPNNNDVLSPTSTFRWYYA